jgi:anti-sigma regulatory factor (Ser/Thr protein kinase)
MPAEVLRVPASTQSLRLLAGYVAELADAASLSERDAYRLRLALDELFTNVVAYAYGDATGQVQLVGSTRDGLVELQIIDTGPAFDTVDHREPSRAQVSLSDRPLGGHAKVGNLLNDAPLTLGASTPAAEFTSCIIDEFSLFARALSNEEVAKLFLEVAGPNAAAQIADEGKPVSAAPEIATISLNGLTRGHATVLAISGTNLLPEPLLVSSAPIEKLTLRPGATPERIEIEVSVPATAPAGHFPLRIQTPHGISNALVGGIQHRDGLTLTVEAALPALNAQFGILSKMFHVRAGRAGA